MIKYLVLALFLVGCEYSSWLPNNPPKYIPVKCDNVICFPDYIHRIGPSFDTLKECKEYIKDRTSPSEMDFIYCREV